MKSGNINTRNTEKDCIVDLNVYHKTISVLMYIFPPMLSGSNFL